MKYGKYNSYLCQTMWKNANHVLSWAELLSWAEILCWVELLSWTELLAPLSHCGAARMEVPRPALLEKGGFRTWCGGAWGDGGGSERYICFHLLFICLAICCFGELSYTGSWQLTCEAFFAKRIYPWVIFLALNTFLIKSFLLIKLELMLVVLPGGQNWNQLSVEFSFLLNVPAL